jgi:hypothetical protein
MNKFEPFFIVGFQRSGTTLLRMMLDSHPQVAVPFDTVGLWERYHFRLAEYGHLRSESDVRRIIGDILQEERIKLWEVPLTVDKVVACHRLPCYPGIFDAFYLAYAREKNKELWGDKDPGNMHRIQLINGWFPKSRIVHIIRDGRDACLSLLKQDFGYRDVLECAHAWAEEVRWVRRIGAVMGEDRYAEVIYEQLVQEPEREMRRLCEFLHLDYSGDMLAYHKRVNSAIPTVKRHLWELIGKPPQVANALRWKSQMSNAERICFEKRSRPVLAEMNYEVLPLPVRGAYFFEVRNMVANAWRALRRRM